jgi:hypothetical protein
LKDLKVDGSYWRQFHKQLQCHLKQKHTKFWENGFEILQNIEDRATLQKHVTRARAQLQWLPLTQSQMKLQKKQNKYQTLIK